MIDAATFLDARDGLGMSDYGCPFGQFASGSEIDMPRYFELNPTQRSGCRRCHEQNV